MDLTAKLFSMKDEKYKEFNAKLIPTVDPNLIIGVRTPELRNLAKEAAKTVDGGEFIRQLPHKYYDENNLHAFIVECIKDYETALYETKRFLPFVDNWATCDLFLPKVFGKNKERLIEENRLSVWVHNKTIQKATESRRISTETKAYLRSLKR